MNMKNGASPLFEIIHFSTFVYCTGDKENIITWMTDHTANVYRILLFLHLDIIVTYQLTGCDAKIIVN
jgi:hypothetical protein